MAKIQGGYKNFVNIIIMHTSMLSLSWMGQPLKDFL